LDVPPVRAEPCQWRKLAGFTRPVFANLRIPAKMLIDMQQFGRSLILMGLILLAVGLLFTYGDRLPLRLGRLPGDITIRGKNSVFYFPLATSILVSAVLSLVFWLLGRR